MGINNYLRVQRRGELGGLVERALIFFNDADPTAVRDALLRAGTIANPLYHDRIVAYRADVERLRDGCERATLLGYDLGGVVGHALHRQPLSECTCKAAS